MRKFLWISWITLVSCSARTPTVSTKIEKIQKDVTIADVRMIPRKELLIDTVYSLKYSALSPSGKRWVWASGSPSDLQLHLVSVDSPKENQEVPLPDKKFSSLTWLDESTILFTYAKKLTRLDLESQTWTTVFEGPHQGCLDVQCLEIVIVRPNPQKMELEVVAQSVKSGESRRLVVLSLTQVQGLWNQFISTRGDVVLHRILPDGRAVIDWNRDGKTMSGEIPIPVRSAWNSTLVEMSQNGTFLYFSDGRSKNTASLSSLNLRTGEVQELVSDPDVDFCVLHDSRSKEEVRRKCPVLLHPETGRVQAASFVHGWRTWKVLDPSLEKAFSTLRSYPAKDFLVLQRTEKDAYWLIEFRLADGRKRQVRFDSANGHFHTLFEMGPPEGARNTIQEFTIPSREKHRLVGYYTLPPNLQNQAIPPRPVPTVLFVKSQASGRMFADDLSPEVSLLLNRGYAVAFLNVRGSSGFGADQLWSIQNSLGAKSAEDIQDARDWLVKQGIADPSRVAVMGGSTGGYYAVNVAVRQSSSFACAYSFNGYYNLNTHYNKYRSFADAPLFYRLFGDPNNPEHVESLKANSPIHAADRIQIPVLVEACEDDPLAPIASVEELIGQLQTAKKPYLYHRYPKCGHGSFNNLEDFLASKAVMEHFFAHLLGGRKEPFGETMRKSSGRVTSGGSLEQLVEKIKQTHEHN